MGDIINSFAVNVNMVDQRDTITTKTGGDPGFQMIVVCVPSPGTPGEVPRNLNVDPSVEEMVTGDQKAPTLKKKLNRVRKESQVTTA